MIKNLEQYPIVKNIEYDADSLIQFENKIVDIWEAGKIKGPVHFSNGNEQELIEIFKRIKETDWIFVHWRSHYHALLHGVDPKWLETEIINGHSIALVNKDKKFYCTAIVSSSISIAVGVALSLKQEKKDEKVWCFVGDMSFETGAFYEMYKYATNHDLPITFVVEDNGLSTNTPTADVWGGKREVPENVIWYNYKSKWPHYGTGKWIAF